MRRIWCYFFFFVGLWVGQTGYAGQAQVSIGSVYGRVTERGGTPLPGVRVRLTSPQIPARERMTGPDGRYWFSGLPPGHGYRMHFRREGYRPVVCEDLEIHGRGQTRVDLVLEPSARSERMVSNAGPVVDVKKTGVSTRFTREDLQTLPTARDP